MICKNCGYKMQDDSDFCMNCGIKVGKESTEAKQVSSRALFSTKCKKCGKEIPIGSVFCNACGTKQTNTKIKVRIGVVIIVVMMAIIIGVMIHNNNLKSPIEGVSEKVYMQGQEYLEEMESSSSKKKVMEYVNNNTNEPLNDIHKNIDSVTFSLDMGKKPSEEEQYYSDLILKFWESYTICYAHEAIIAEYEDSDEAATQMVISMYKGIISEFKDQIAEAKEVLENADSMDDMREARRILEEIWE